MDASATARRLLSYWLGYSHQGNRDLYGAFGYEREVSGKKLLAMYYRNDLANRIVRIFPQSTWRDEPAILDDAGNTAEESAFVEAFEDFAEEKKLFRFLERADRVASFGRFGLIVCGFNDGRPMSEPLQRGDAPLLYLSAFPDIAIVINTYDLDVTSPRYGLPVTYSINNAPDKLLLEGGGGASKNFLVHHSRVLHLSEFLDSDDVFGTPRLLPGYNRLLDLEKVLGGASEIFWKIGNRGIMFTADKDANLDDEQIAAIKDQAEDLDNQLRRYIVGTGITANVLGADSPDPSLTMASLLDVIAGTYGVPKRILLGSEMGQLASGQDENNWQQRTCERRKAFASPSILRPFINLMIETGNLPRPAGKWKVDPVWHTESPPPVEAATIAASRSTALATYANSPGAEYVVPKEEFRRDILGLPAVSEFETPLEEYEPFPAEPEEFEPDPLEVDDFPDAFEEEGVSINEALVPAYVYRDVLNRRALDRWARERGLRPIDPEPLHITICYSKEPIQRARALLAEDAALTIMPSHSRALSIMGDNQSIVLEIDCPALAYRHDELVALGASHDYEGYRPHITLYKNGAGIDISKAQPYAGAIVLGLEKFEEIEEAADA